MRTTIVSLSVVVALMATPILSAQSQRTPLDTTVKLVSDRRSTSFFSKLSLIVELPDISAADLSAVRLSITSAVDDTGRMLFEPTDEEPAFFPVRRGGPGADDPSKRASVDIGLLNPARDAVTLKEVTGEIDLYIPSRDPDAIVTVPDALSKVGKAISHKALKESGVVVTVVDAQTIEAEKADAVEAHTAELKEQGYEGDDLNWMVEDFEEMYYVPSETELAMRIEDPDGRIQELELIDAAGDSIRAYPMEQGDLTVLSTFEPLGKDIGVRINLRTPKTVSSHTFSIKDVKLP